MSLSIEPTEDLSPQQQTILEFQKAANADQDFIKFLSYVPTMADIEEIINPSMKIP